MCIPVSDLRKGNLVRTEHGILPVHHLVFGDVYVLGKDQRVLYAREVEGVGIGEIESIKGCQSFIKEVLKYWLFVHEMQNYYYWNNRKELELKL